jgi:hypothetical protein
MRFVEWFTSRGENYEHNMKTIDKHLSHLSKNFEPNSHKLSPYNGEIKYTSVMHQKKQFDSQI